MRILLTGGAGYIGSHTAIALVAAGHDVICFDNLSTSRIEVMDRLSIITGQKIPLIVGDVRDRPLLEQTIRDHDIEAVIHFAGLKAVGEAAEKPFLYYDNNVRGTLCLIEAMTNCNVKTIAFSSSATVYGEPQYLPLDEKHPTAPTNAYGRTKRMVEEVLTDIAAADPDWSIAVLRYFNPVGAHESGLIGEDPSGIPNNLLPFVSRVASGRLPELTIFGDDYGTPDGTGIRDYIHVTDLADGHIAALHTITKRKQPVSIWNLGTGHGFSVMEILRTFERVNGVSIPYKVGGRRTGDVEAYYSNAALAKTDLGWETNFTLEQMCASAWRFEQSLASLHQKSDNSFHQKLKK